MMERVWLVAGTLLWLLHKDRHSWTEESGYSMPRTLSVSSGADHKTKGVLLVPSLLVVMPSTRWAFLASRFNCWKDASTLVIVVPQLGWVKVSSPVFFSYMCSVAPVHFSSCTLVIIYMLENGEDVTQL